MVVLQAHVLVPIAIIYWNNVIVHLHMLLNWLVKLTNIPREIMFICPILMLALYFALL